MHAFETHTKAAILGVVMAATCYTSAVDATIIYNAAGTSNINTSVYDNVLVDHASAIVNVNSRGIVRGVNDPSLGMFNTAVRTRRGNRKVTGPGRILAAAGQSAINMAGNGSVVRLSSRASVIGDVVNEFTTPGWRAESTAITRLYIEDNARVTGNVRYAGFMRMEDNARVLGSIINPSNGSMSLDMRGGLVTGQLQMGGLNDYVFDMSGGSILGGFRGASGYVDMTMTGGTISNGFQTGTAITGGIYGGSINGGVDLTNGGSAASHLIIDGGEFNTDPGDYLFSMSHTPFGSPSSASLDIYGGEFGYVEQGLGFFLDQFVDFSVYGWDLALTGGVLSGYLLDGSWFSNPFTFGAGWSGTFNIYNVMAPMAMTASLDTLSAFTTLESHSVPEPGTMGMLAACVLGMMMFGRRRFEGASIFRM
ncbi:MAG: PEP-CTERM sorting domain-containing protein [Steroidobacter sp.]